MTHYEEFGLPSTATPEEIQRAHRHLVRLLHPDPIQDEEARRLAESQLKRLNGIYSILADPVQRRSYDLRLARPATGGPHQLALHGFEPPRYPPPPCPPARRQVAWAAVTIALLAGFLFAAWWKTTDPPAERVVYIERSPAIGPTTIAPSPVAAAGSAAAAAAEDMRQMALEIRDLKRLLNQAALERDRALARLASDQSTAAGTPSVGSAMAATSAPSRLPAAPGAAMPAVPIPTATATVAAGASASNREPPMERVPALAGTWIYSATGARQSPSDQYSAEYIELLVAEREGLLWGRYRARYKVPDRALSPEVEFYFEGSASAARAYSWRGTAGSKGEVRLKLLSDNVLSVDWFTSQLGRSLMLGSGTAVLVRRHQFD